MQNLSYGLIIALGTKEDIMGWWWGGGGAHFLQVIIKSKFFVQSPKLGQFTFFKSIHYFLLTIACAERIFF